MHIAKLITSCRYEAQLKNKKLKHRFRPPPFWQTPCYVQPNFPPKHLSHTPDVLVKQ